MEWKSGATYGQVVANGNGEGNENNQLNGPIDVIVDNERDSLIICDWGNRRVLQRPRRDGASTETIIENVLCYGLAMDNEGFLYVSDEEKDEVRRWKVGEKNGTLVAGGNGRGQSLNQLNSSAYIFVDENHTVYVSDSHNHRVMKWLKGAKEGIVVAGGQGNGNALTQLFRPQGVVVDQSGTVYVADSWNHRIMCWPLGAKQGNIIIGSNDYGDESSHLSTPYDISFDRQGNLYVVEYLNNRVRRFSIDGL